ncbi:hypothetical protein EI94DRAFT_1877228 [Lactarius quietus]|nr:hypothetical protein EI94DRAFT_1877228 [Lactarius quietus]
MPEVLGPDETYEKEAAMVSNYGVDRELSLLSPIPNTSRDIMKNKIPYGSGIYVEMEGEGETNGRWEREEEKGKVREGVQGREGEVEGCHDRQITTLVITFRSLSQAQAPAAHYKGGGRQERRLSDNSEEEGASEEGGVKLAAGWADWHTAVSHWGARAYRSMLKYTEENM